jgi:hypothetical protein
MAAPEMLVLVQPIVNDWAKLVDGTRIAAHPAMTQRTRVKTAPAHQQDRLVAITDIFRNQLTKLV